MFFETFFKILVNILFFWLSNLICNAQEYTARNVDCSSTFQAVSYNVRSKGQCLQKCLQENCFHILYASQSCHRYGKNPLVASNGNVIGDTYKILAMKNIAHPGLSTSQSSTFSTAASFYAIDGNEGTSTGTDWDNPAWWMVDLGSNYYIVQIGFFIIDVHVYYFTSMKIFLFDSNVSPTQFSLQPLFASYPGPPTVDRFNISGSQGMCGRYLVVQCESNHAIELVEVAIYSLDGVITV